MIKLLVRYQFLTNYDLPRSTIWVSINAPTQDLFAELTFTMSQKACRCPGSHPASETVPGDSTERYECIANGKRLLVRMAIVVL